MTDDRTARLGLPLLHAGQAQKEMDHNEALLRLDLAVQPVVISIGRNDPPDAPETGACWVVGSDPVGAWAGRANAVAGWTQGGWRFLAAIAGMSVSRRDDGMPARFDGNTWVIGALQGSALFLCGVQVLSERQPAIAHPSGGGTIDAEARAVLGSVLSALQEHGLIGR